MVGYCYSKMCANWLMQTHLGTFTQNAYNYSQVCESRRRLNMLLPMLTMNYLQGAPWQQTPSVNRNGDVRQTCRQCNK